MFNKKRLKFPHNIRHITGSPTTTTTTTTTITDSRKPRVIVSRAHCLMSKMPIRSGCHRTAGDSRLWRASRTWEVQAWSRWYGAIWWCTTLQNSNRHVTITNVTMIVQYAAHPIPLLVRWPRAVWPDTVSGLVLRYTQNVTVINVVWRNTLMVVTLRLWLVYFLENPAFSEMIFMKLAILLLPTGHLTYQTPVFLKFPFGFWKKLHNLHVVLTCRFWSFLADNSPHHVHTFVAPQFHLPSPNLVDFFQFIKAQSNKSPAIRVHFLTETVLGELT